MPSPCCYGYPLFPVAVSQDLPSPNYLIGNFSWDAAQPAQGQIVWSSEPSKTDPARPAPDAVGSARAEAGTDAFQVTGGDLGLRPAPDEFVSQPVPYTLHLNVSRMIQLDLWVTGDAKPSTNHIVSCGAQCSGGGSTNSNGPCGGTALNVELWAGNQFVAGGVGGQTILGFLFDRPWPFYEPPPADPGFLDCFYRMPPEVATIPAGTTLKVRVIHVDEGGTIQYGMAGKHRSQIRIPFYDPEEWFFRNPNPGPPAAPAPGAAGGASMSPSWALGLGVAVVSLGRRRPAAVAAAILLGLSGCLGTSDPEGGDPASASRTGGVDVEQVEDDLLAGAGNGSILGTVRDDLGFPLGGTHVSILGTDSFTNSDGRGHFAFRDLRPATYDLRFDKSGYKTLEVKVTVRSGFVARSDATMVPLIAKEGDDRRHHHDYWGGGLTLPIFDDDVTGECLDGHVGLDGYSCLWGATFRLAPATDANLATPKTVVPGTTRAEITVTWQNAQAPFTKLGLQVLPNGGVGCPGRHCYQNWSQFYPRESGKPFQVETAWEMTDAGHQLASTWKLQLYEPTSENQGLARDTENYVRLTTTTPVFHVKIVLHKGVVPYEPPHPDIWEGADSLNVMSLPGRSVPTSFCGSIAEAPAPGNDGTVNLGSPQFVPMDTEWIEILLNRSALPLVAWDWHLAYHPANLPPVESGVYSDFVKVPPDGGAGTVRLSWRIPVAGMSDGAYAGSSAWVFVIFPSDPKAFCVDSQQNWGNLLDLHPGPTFSFEAIVHRDPLA